MTLEPLIPGSVAVWSAHHHHHHRRRRELVTSSIGPSVYVASIVAEHSHPLVNRSSPLPSGSLALFPSPSLASRSGHPFTAHGVMEVDWIFLINSLQLLKVALPNHPILAVVAMSNSSHQRVATSSILDPRHKNPFAFDSTDPLVLFIVQAVIIISVCNLIGLAFRRIRQPQVIAEVIGGIILGPTAFGKIPHFSDTIFPKNSLPFLSLVANIGLILFLFIIGLEVDFKIAKKNWRASLGVALAGLIIPFGIGAAVSVGIYNKFVDHDTVDFSHFLLFICVAFAITAFPVLCRILTELKLLQTQVGMITLSAGVANDVIGWILLALTVALVNSGAGLTALYIILCILGLVLFLVFVVRPAFIELARRSGSFESGPSLGLTCLVFLMTFTTAWFTEILGVHAIFGAFLIGIIIPHDGGFAHSLVAMIEDLVKIFFLPLYFALSGLSTDLTKLNSGILWAWTICILLAAALSKFLPCFAVGLLGGMNWRESGAIGSLMSCKGLVELIVLNIGLNAGVLNSQVFAMFVLMAVVTTFSTTPLTLLFYPESRRRALDRKSSLKRLSYEENSKSNILVVLSQFDHLTGVMTFLKLLQPHPTIQSENQSEKANTSFKSDFSPQVAGLRLLELSQRTTDVMKANEVEETEKLDPLLNIFTTFASLSDVIVSSVSMSIVAEDEFVTEISSEASRLSTQLVILPWCANLSRSPQMDWSIANPIGRMLSARLESAPQYATLVRSLFRNVSSDVGVLLDLGSSNNINESIKASKKSVNQAQPRLFCVFIGGPDDRVALSLTLQLAHHSNALVTVLRVCRTDQPKDVDEPTCSKDSSPRSSHHVMNQMTLHVGQTGKLDTIYPSRSSQTKLVSETNDNLLWAKAEEMAKINKRLIVDTLNTLTPLQAILHEVGKLKLCREFMIITGRSRQGGETHTLELSQLLKQQVGGEVSQSTDLVSRLGIVASSDVRKSLGDVTSALVASQIKCKFLVIQAGRQDKEDDSNKIGVEDMVQSP
ncbi:hypothetical protein O181_012113 [Austropuccinia psidii MF-1]|uniref:Cation/H+ exchanger transmembrane domain-containing protein n=1 Tax=Austropuccinia psidii MF-1 TaxID=1389203 RepID=A0A9Q3BW62_9BASI|nr:hypothetical protein [Austropuccinia psidii MF-1]